MSNAIGHVKDLDSSRTEALQGLLRSLGHTNNDPATLSTEHVKKLSEKIKEILGDGEDPGLALGHAPSQLRNEDGLPIIDISEPVDEDFQTSTSSPPVPQQDMIPLSLLPPDVRERRRRERDRILDLLEEEERLQQPREERDAEEEQKEAIRKRKESAKAELEQLKAARELQKRMGQALVQHAKGAGENGQKEDARPKPQTTASIAKKCVSFADAPAVEDDESDQQMSIDQPGWGDVTLARLRANTRVPLVSTAEAQKYPMKLRVVERRPLGSPPSSLYNDADSDDESASAGQLSPPLEHNSSGEDRPSSSSNNGLSDDELLEEGFDYGFAQHHREIALEYHEKRHVIGAETAKAMRAHSLDDHDHDQLESLQSNRQLPLSRFRADRMAAAYDKSHDPVSTSIGQTVIPASRQRSLRNSVRLGKLENGQLVGGEAGESGSEDETTREVIQMLQTGNLQNVGPDFKTSSIIAPPRSSDTTESPPMRTSTVVREAKPSRFKVAHGGGLGTGNGNSSYSQPAVSNVIERKAPRSYPTQRFSVNKPPPRSPVEPAPPMFVDSPSFPMSSASATQGSMIQSPDPTSMERHVSKFMAERKKLTK